MHFSFWQLWVIGYGLQVMRSYVIGQNFAAALIGR